MTVFKNDLLKRALLKCFDCPDSYETASVKWGTYARCLMRLGVIIYVLFVPLGHAPREIGSILAVTGVLFFYLLDFNNSNLSRFRLKWIFFIFFAFLAFKVMHSVNIGRSWEVFNNVYKGLFLFFPALEFIRSKKDLKILITLFAIMGCYEGLDGIYQFFFGEDLIRGTIADPRLTGSMKTPRVGNLTSLVIPISCGLYFILKNKWGIAKTIGTMFILIFPLVFLFVGSQTRSAYVGVFLAAIGTLMLIRGVSWKYIIAAVLCVFMVGTFGPSRVSFERAIHGERFEEVWPLAWQSFLKNPILGGGIHSYKPMAQSTQLGKKLEGEGEYIHPHPHNIYLQFATETGVVGLALALIFFGTYLFWSAKRIRMGLKNLRHREHFILATCFWASYLGYLGTAFSAHNFFRAWWLGTAIIILGVLTGSCLKRTSEATEAEDR
jgi:O-antigen ligase